jgi:signal transduction histidine kinase
MTDIRAFGAAIGVRLGPILRGARVEKAAPDAAQSWSAPVVDWRALRRFGIDEGRLAPGTEVRFRAPSAWAEHRAAILGIAAAFAVLLLLIARLLQERRRRLRAEAESNARMTELARANRISTAGELAAAIAHDLGQPLAAIDANVDSVALLLQADPPRVDEALAALADVRRDDQRAVDVIARLRSLFRNAEPHPDTLWLDRLVGDVVGMASGAAGRKGVQIETDLDPRPMRVRADAVQLQQVFINLLINALDAIPEGAAQRKVVVSARRLAAGGIRLGVADSGTGIAESERARVLEPFYTTKANGTGVGLAIVRRIVESHGAQVEISRSRLGGAELSFVLPDAGAGT